MYEMCSHNANNSMAMWEKQEVNSASAKSGRCGTLTRYQEKTFHRQCGRPEQDDVFEKCISCSEIITFKVSRFGPNVANIVSPLDGGGRVLCRTPSHPHRSARALLDTEALLFIAAPGVRGSEHHAAAELLLKRAARRNKGRSKRQSQSRTAVTCACVSNKASAAWKGRLLPQ